MAVPLHDFAANCAIDISYHCIYEHRTELRLQNLHDRYVFSNNAYLVTPTFARFEQ